MSARVCTGNKRCPTQTSERLRPAMISCKFQAQQARCGVCVCVCCVLCVCDLSISLSLSIYLSIYLSIPLSISISLSLSIYIYIYIYIIHICLCGLARACVCARARAREPEARQRLSLLPGRASRPASTTQWHRHPASPFMPTLRCRGAGCRVSYHACRDSTHAACLHRIITPRATPCGRRHSRRSPSPAVLPGSSLASSRLLPGPSLPLAVKPKTRVRTRSTEHNTLTI